MSTGGDPGTPGAREAVLALVRDVLRAEAIGGRETVLMEEHPMREGEILELSQGMIVPARDTVDAPASATQPVPAPSEPAPIRPAMADDAPSHSVQSPAFSAQAFAALREAVRSRKPSVATHRGGPTIEDILREEMRPLLREWLDRNLGGIVERAVRQEVDRLSRQEDL